VIDREPIRETDHQVAANEGIPDYATLLEVEPEPESCVLPATLEATPARLLSGNDGDRRLQLLCHPVSIFLDSLHRDSPDRGRGGNEQLLTFEREQLVDVVAALDGPSIDGPVCGRMEPQPGAWGAHLGLEGWSTAPRGHRWTATFFTSAVGCASDCSCGATTQCCANAGLRQRTGDSLKGGLLDSRLAPLEARHQA
jgi:hypothetical protein